MTRGIIRYLRRHCVALLALFVALGGTSYAASTALIGKNTVASPQVVNGSLQTVDLSKKARKALKGQRGARGAQGAQGAQGAKGATGPVGPATGAAGGALAGTYPNPSLAPPENRHVVGAAGEPAYQNGWGTYPLARDAGFYKDPFGIVHIDGAISGGTISAGFPPTNTVFTLPAGYRPANFVYFAPSSTGGSFNPVVAGAGIQSDGQLFIYAGNNAFVSLDGMTFRAGA
jgi:hypothetical protein